MRFDASTPPTVFVVFAAPPAEREGELHHWYDTVHGPDSLANGSFRALHRFVAAGGGWRAAPFLALWEGEYANEADAWAYITPRAQALRAEGRAGDADFVRFSIMLFAVAGAHGAGRTGTGVRTVRTVTTVQNDWRGAADAPDVATWWRRAGLDERLAAHEGACWLLTSDPAGRGAGHHLAVFATDSSLHDASRDWEGIGTPGMSPLPPYRSIFGADTGSGEPAPPPSALAWVMHWAPVVSQRPGELATTDTTGTTSR